ncbi:hypothetical protein Tco_0605648 [Tanacetum coccineum]
MSGSACLINMHWTGRKILLCWLTSYNSSMTTPIATFLQLNSQIRQQHKWQSGSRDRPPMLATGRYAQWRSRFLRYIDTRPNGDALRKCILTGPYTPTMVTTPAVPATEDSPEVPAKKLSKKKLGC